MSSTSAEPHADDESCQRPVQIRGACTEPILQNSLGGGIEDIKLPALMHDYLYIYFCRQIRMRPDYPVRFTIEDAELRSRWLILRGVTTLL